MLAGDRRQVRIRISSLTGAVSSDRTWAFLRSPRVIGTTLRGLRMADSRWDEKADPRWTSDTLSSNRTRLGARKDRLVMKNSTIKRRPKKGATKATKDVQESITIGVDLGDKASRYCVLNGTGEVRKKVACPRARRG